MKNRIECATRKDYQQFAEVHKRFVYLSSSELRETIMDEETFNEYADMGRIFVAFDGDIMVGYAVVTAYEDGKCHINEIFVLPEYQHKGYGKQIVDKIIVEAKESGLNKLLVFSLLIETDAFWMRRCFFFESKEEDEAGYLIRKI